MDHPSASPAAARPVQRAICRWPWLTPRASIPERDQQKQGAVLRPIALEILDGAW